tara:strand:+ start:563 stop:667 length:105 start_codon:yes stop_codon:yes gene_type:complete
VSGNVASQLRAGGNTLPGIGAKASPAGKPQKQQG